jgi:hypothetical protein
MEMLQSSWPGFEVFLEAGTLGKSVSAESARAFYRQSQDGW